MSEINMLKVPYFIKASSLAVLQESLQPGKYLAENLDRIAYVFVSDTKSLYHVSIDKTISLIGGGGSVSTEEIVWLPRSLFPTIGDPKKLYISGEDMYVWLNGEYKQCNSGGAVSEIEWKEI